MLDRNKFFIVEEKKGKSNWINYAPLWATQRAYFSQGRNVLFQFLCLKYSTNKNWECTYRAVNGGESKMYQQGGNYAKKIEFFIPKWNEEKALDSVLEYIEKEPDIRHLIFKDVFGDSRSD